MRTTIPALLFLILLASCRTAQAPVAAGPAPREERGRPEPGFAPPAPEEAPAGEPLRLPDPPGKVPADQERIVEQTLRKLSLEQLIGQRLLTGVPGTRAGERARRLVREGYVGGILLLGQNVANREQLIRLTADLQALAAQNSPRVGLLVAVDQEGGRVSRLDMDRLSRFPPPRDWAAYRDPLYVQSVAYITAREALALGCNLNLAPVLDLYARADGTIIGDRSLGDGAAEVAELGLAYLAGAHRAGLAAAIKHFPGHGRTVVDTHQRLAVLDVDTETLWREDLLPFRRAIEDGVDAVMTAHILYPRLDPDFPVTLSSKIVRGLLRGRLGFEGVVISDDIEMGALAGTYPVREILKRSIAAGVDLILAIGGLDALKLSKEIKDLLERGEISREQVEEGARRVLRLKAKYGLLPG